MSDLDLYEIKPAQPNACVIWLHGLGAGNRDFIDVLPYLKLPKQLAIHYIFPQAPDLPVTVNGGYIMPAWYDILEINIDRKVDRAQLFKSAQHIQAIIAQQIQLGLAPERIVLIGFSQGGAVAIQTAVMSEYTLGGLAVLSSYLAIPEAFVEHKQAAKIPVLVQHGNQDDVVALALGDKAAQRFREEGFNVQWQTFNMGHQVNLASLEALGYWLTRILS